MHHIPLSFYYSQEQLKSFYNAEQIKALYGNEQLKALYGQEHLKALYNHEQLKALCNPDQLKSLQALQGSPESLKSHPTSPLLAGSPPSSMSSSIFSIDNILSPSRPLMAHRPTPTYPYPYPSLPQIAPEMLGK